MKYDVIIIGAGPLKTEIARNVRQKSVSDVNHVRLRRDLPAPVHFRMESCPFLRMSGAIFRKFSGMTGRYSC